MGPTPCCAFERWSLRAVVPFLDPLSMLVFLRTNDIQSLTFLYIFFSYYHIFRLDLERESLEGVGHYFRPFHIGLVATPFVLLALSAAFRCFLLASVILLANKHAFFTLKKTPTLLARSQGGGAQSGSFSFGGGKEGSPQMGSSLFAFWWRGSPKGTILMRVFNFFWAQKDAFFFLFFFFAPFLDFWWWEWPQDAILICLMFEMIRMAAFLRLYWFYR